MIAHKDTEARQQFDQILERDPDFGPALFYLSQVQAMHGQWADAVSTLQKLPPRGAALPGRSWSPDAKGYAEFMDAASEGAMLSDAAVAYSLAGNRDKAFANLEKAQADRDDEITAVIRFPAFDHSEIRPPLARATAQTQPTAIAQLLKLVILPALSAIAKGAKRRISLRFLVAQQNLLRLQRLQPNSLLMG